MKPSVKEIVHQYVNAWNNEGLEVFKTEFAKCLAPEVKYTDPNIEADGPDGVAALAQGSLEKAPERKFRAVTEPEYHHNVARYTWEGTGIPTGRVEGQDILEFNEVGLITRIITFF
ncbi:nuclear transport factor 2 family protein [Flavobacterium sp. RHBU_3]|uniref:nuclear transport factor 2 family protein n=1 Tax=Flavobacterium sp. RHBU_3 TaxID=3391184 RepID=UPI003985618C